MRGFWGVAGRRETFSAACYAHLEARLRALGFANATDEDSPICRWLCQGLVVDVMPFDEAILGFGNRFHREGHATAISLEVGDGVSVWVMPPAVALAAKVEAFLGRGLRDPWASRDLEDIVLLVEGRMNLVDEVFDAPASVRGRIAEWARQFVQRSDAADLIEAHVSPGTLHAERAALAHGRIRKLAGAP